MIFALCASDIATSLQLWGGDTHTRTDTHSRRSYKRNVPVQKRNTSRNGGENMSAELDEKYENAWHSVA